MQKLGQNIRELRHSWGESLLDLSLVLNKNTSTISQWESGKRTPNNEILYQIANHYKVTVDELLNGDFSDLPSKVDYFVNVKENIEQLQIEELKLFPLKATQSDMENSRFLEALNAHRKLRKCELEVVNTTEFEQMLDIYIECFENNDSLAAGANILSYLFWIASYNLATPYLDELADYLTSDDSIDKKRDAKFFIANYVLNSDLLGDCEDECLDFKEMDELVLYIIEKLKKDVRFAKLADYYFVLRYLFGFANNDLGDVINSRMSIDLLLDLSKVHNPYAKQFLYFFRKIL